MATSPTIPLPNLTPLKFMVSGPVFAPGDDGYDAARQAWNLEADQWPAAVVEPESVVDVVRAVRFARSHGMRVAPQSTGHGAGPLERLDDAILLKTTRMRRVEIDAAARSARVEAGAQWEDVTVPADTLGLAALAGTAPDVGVAGYTLGGGVGWLARRHGLAANRVTAVEVVTPDGRLRRCDAEHEPDLFWAVKGGGGGLGVVTALEFGLIPVSALYAGALLFPIERASEILHAWRRWTQSVPDEITSLGRLLRLPPIEDIPAPLRGRAFALVEAAFIGDAEAGTELLRPLRELGPELDTFAAIRPPALAGLNMDPDQPMPAVGDGVALSNLAPEALDTILNLAGPGADTLLQSIEIRHLGGALARKAPGAGAQPTVEAAFAIFAGGFPVTPDLGPGTRADLDALKAALTPWRAGYDYFNFSDVPSDADAVLPSASYARLRQIKATYDPDQTIVSAHPVRPSDG